MKIFHIAGGGDKGGARPHIIDLCATLGREHDITLVSLRSGPFEEKAREAGVKTWVIYSRLVPADYMKLVSLVRREKPSIVHCHGAKANVAGVLVKLFTRTPIVSTIHSDWKLDYLHSFLKRNTIGRINGAALRFFDYYTTVSDQFKRMLTGRGFSPLRTMTIYNGIDFDKKAPRDGRREYLRSLGLNYREGDIVLGLPARLEPVKDIPTLLQAFKIAVQDNPRLKLVIGGDGAEAGRLKLLTSELGLGGHVCFPGWVENVPRLFAACDIDVLTSISESFPYTILEGIREGCAVITSDVGGMGKLIDHGENGYIFPPGDVDALAGYILELSLDSAKRQRFASALFEKASREYSLKSMAETQLSIYQRILSLEARKGGRDGVLVCGAYGRGNSGDEAILQAIIGSLRELDPQMPITVMTRKPRQTRIQSGVDAIYTFNLFRFLPAMGRCRLFINGGGSLIQDATSSRSLFFYLFTIRAAKKLGCKVLMYGCGIGRVSRPLNRKLSRRVINRCADIITLRDSVSMQELEDMGIDRPDIRAAADPALSLRPAPAQEARRYLANHGLDPDVPKLCFSVRSWKDFENYEVFGHAADYAWRRYGLRPVFLPIETPKDLEPSYKAALAMRSPYVLLGTPRDIGLTLAILREMRLVCAMRLHALVFSAAARVPMVASSYDIKVSSFMSYIGSDACCDLTELTEEWLCQQIDATMTHPGIDAQVLERLEALEKQNALAAQELLADASSKI